MTYFPDLTPYMYLSREPNSRVLNVGWLDVGKEYPKGDVPQDFVSKLLKLYQDHQSQFTRGWHSCPFCPVGSQRTREMSSTAEIAVEKGGVVFRAPALILHYVLAHQYRPPQEFIDAVLEGTPVEDRRS